MKLYKIKYRYQAEEYVFVEATGRPDAVELIKQHFEDNPSFELIEIVETTYQEAGFETLDMSPPEKGMLN